MVLTQDFLADLSHKIRTPLNGVIGMTKLLQDTALSAEQQSYANIIALSSDNLLDSLNDILKTIGDIKEEETVQQTITRELLQEKLKNLKTDYNTPQNFYGLQILIVEDNLVNHMIAKRLLNNCNCMVSVAENGLEALDLVKETVFDLIFMDCQMPKMDGYEATRKIIEYEKSNNLNHVPIVALTANVMGGDVEKCRAAGMDDYISKPIKPKIMVDVILRWKRALLTERADKEKAEKEKRHILLIDENTLTVLHAMTEDNFIPILESYIKMAGKGCDAIFDAIIAKDAVRLRRESHSLKSSSRQIGALQIGELAAEFEKRAIAENFEGISYLFEDFSLLNKRVEAHLKNYIELFLESNSV
ncbi:MAG: response regulator [Emcibacter sp.]|nr:response regulator [Emcibacter sp.]